MPLDTAVAATLKKYELGNDAVWQHKQSGQWIMKHWACEHVALKAGVEFDAPVIVDASAADKLAVIVVRGRMGEHSEWSFGEAAPYNTQQSYPFAMAEKRAKDRVILKLIGVHGKLYSEEEADSFKESAPATNGNKTGDGDYWGGPLGKTQFKEAIRQFDTDLNACSDYDELMALLNQKETTALMEQCKRDAPSWWHGKEGSDVEGISSRIERRKAELAAKEQNTVLGAV